jgi:hypothetical protein
MYQCQHRVSPQKFTKNALSFWGSLINHSCTPNILQSFTTDDEDPAADSEEAPCMVAKVIAMRGIAKGEELFSTYLGDHQNFLDTDGRREVLERWDFTCNCESCSTRKDDKTRQVISRMADIVNLHSSPPSSWKLQRYPHRKYANPYRLDSTSTRKFTDAEVRQFLFDLTTMLEQVGAYEYLPNCYSMVMEAFAFSEASRREEIIMYAHWKLREFMSRISTFREQVLFGLGYPSLARPKLSMSNIKDRIQHDQRNNSGARLD